MNKEKIDKKQSELYNQKKEIMVSTAKTVGFSLPAFIFLYICTDNPDTKNIVATTFYFSQVGIFCVHELYKDIKKYIQLRKELQNQR